MPGLRLLPLGVGNAFSALSYSTCLALEAEGCWLLIDCPHPIRKMMREASATVAVDLDADAVHAVVLTHLHADHISGVEGLAFYSRFLLKRKLRLLAHPKVSEHLWSGHLAAGMGHAKQQQDMPEVEFRFDDFSTCATCPNGNRFPAGRSLSPCTPRRIRSSPRRFSSKPPAASSATVPTRPTIRA